MEAFVDWFMGLGERYNVNPIVFGSIYVGAIPFFTASIAWLVRNLRRRRSIVAPVLSASFFFVSAYLYLVVVGRDIPVWVYFFVGAMVVFGVFSTLKKIREQLKEGGKETVRIDPLKEEKEGDEAHRSIEEGEEGNGTQ